MKQTTVMITTSGKIILEFGGKLSGVCCGEEDRKLRKVLKKFGVDTDLEKIHCHLPRTDIVRAIANGNCHVSNHVNLPGKGGF